MWHDLLAAVALLLVLEGIMPFVNPQGYKNMMRTITGMEDSALRYGGLFSMLGGVVLLYLVK